MIDFLNSLKRLLISRYILIFISFTIIFISPSVGQIDINIDKIFDSNSLDYTIFWELRVPRVIAGFFVGGLLSISGLVFQTIFRNAMSSPYTLGVASGASFGVGFAIVFEMINLVWLFSFIGAISTVIIHLFIMIKIRQYDRDSMLLVGIALSFFYSASLMIFLFLSDQKESYMIMRFTMGSLDISSFNELISIVLVSLFTLFIVLFYRYELKLLLTNKEYAYLKGVDIKRVSYTLLAVLSLGIGVVVASTGPIGFVGLIAPHIIKTLYKQSADRLIIPIFFYGGLFLVMCDLVARSVGGSSDIPIGVVTSFLGGGVFIYLILNRR